MKLPNAAEARTALVEVGLVVFIQALLHQAGDRHDSAGQPGGEALVLVKPDMGGEHACRIDLRRASYD